LLCGYSYNHTSREDIVDVNTFFLGLVGAAFTLFGLALAYGSAVASGD
jgi:hypothetical protein